MKRTTRPTRKSMAVSTKHMWQDPTHLKAGGTVWKGEATVLWTRERNGVRTVFLGELHGFQEQEATSVPEWMDWYTQPMERRRSASYDGTRFWHRGAGLDSDEHILEQFHATGELPAGFVGWWTPGVSMPSGGYGHHQRVDDPTVALCGMTPLMLGVTDGPTRLCPVCKAKKAELASA